MQNNRILFKRIIYIVCIIISYLLVLNPPIIVIAVVLLGAIIFLVNFRQSNPQIFLICLGLVLTGYAFLGKGLAYLDFSYFGSLLFGFSDRMGGIPLYIGEALLLFGLLTLFISRKYSSIMSRPLYKILLLFMILCALQTIPYIENYGIYALRDGMVWVYAIFALIVSSLLIQTGWFSNVIGYFSQIIPWYLSWIIFTAIASFAVISIPLVPGTQGYADIPIVSLKYGDAAVHIAGISAFLLLGLNRENRNKQIDTLALKEWICWVLWFLCFILVSSGSRGGLISIILSLSVIFFLRPFSKWGKIVYIGILGLLLLFSFNIELAKESDRSIGQRQVIENIKSIVDISDRSDLSGTRTWRLNWWRDIVDYTVFGKYFWTGKGFGVNLATDDGYQVLSDEALRSPHNGHLTMLARAGVPGFITWVLLQMSFCILLIRAYGHAVVNDEPYWAKINLWILAYWTAFVVNAGFDVYLEGPQAGIWFWCLFGFGIAALEMQRQKNADITINLNKNL